MRSAAPPFPVRRQRQKGEHANAQPTRTTLPMRDVRDDGPLHETRTGRDPLLRGGNAGAAAAKAALVRLGRRTGGGRPRNIALATVVLALPAKAGMTGAYLPGSAGVPPANALARVTLTLTLSHQGLIGAGFDFVLLMKGGTPRVQRIGEPSPPSEIRHESQPADPLSLYGRGLG